MFNHDPLPSQATISLLLSLRQSMIFGFLERRLTVLMQFRQTLVACICQNAQVFGKITAIVLEQLKIVFAAIAKCRGNNLGALSVSNYLRFLSMLLLFAAVMPFLTFFGRSTGCSLTSTSTTSKTVSAELERFTYSVSHDLKSPLVTIGGFLGFLEVAKKMQRLLDEILELSRIGRLINPPVEVPFEELVREALELANGELTQRQVRVQVEADLPIVKVDHVRMVEVCKI